MRRDSASQITRSPYSGHWKVTNKLNNMRRHTPADCEAEIKIQNVNTEVQKMRLEFCSNLEDEEVHTN